MKSPMVLEHVNAQCFESKIDELQAESDGVDMVTVSETWLYGGIAEDTVSIEGFHSPVRYL